MPEIGTSGYRRSGFFFSHPTAAQDNRSRPACMHRLAR